MSGDNESGVQAEWQKPLAAWRQIFKETPDYDCWPAPIRGWEVGALVRYIDTLEQQAARVTQLELVLGNAGPLVSFLVSCIASGECLSQVDLDYVNSWREKRSAILNPKPVASEADNANS
jgi:hypothetical protein